LCLIVVFVDIYGSTLGYRQTPAHSHSRDIIETPKVKSTQVKMIFPRGKMDLLRLFHNCGYGLNFVQFLFELTDHFSLFRFLCTDDSLNWNFRFESRETNSDVVNDIYHCSDSWSSITSGRRFLMPGNH
jgi:hypothetical protein